jgi:hypothetical protein
MYKTSWLPRPVVPHEVPAELLCHLRSITSRKLVRCPHRLEHPRGTHIEAFQWDFVAVLLARYFVLVPQALIYYHREFKNEGAWAGAAAKGIIELNDESTVELQVKACGHRRPNLFIYLTSLLIIISRIEWVSQGHHGAE